MRLPGSTEILDEYSSQRLSYNPDGTQLASGDGSEIRIWDPQTGELIRSLAGHTDIVWSIAYSADGKQVATGSADQSVRTWEASSGEQILELKGHTYAIGGLAFSPDGKILATSSTDQAVKLWEADSGNLLQTLEGIINPKDIAFSPDGSIMATGAADGAAIFWDPTSGAQFLNLTAPGADTQSLAFSADGKWLATGSGDNTARVWEMATGREIYTLPGSVGGVVGVAFPPNFGGYQLAVASADGIVRVFLLKIDDLVALAKSRLTRALTQEECQVYLHMEQCPAADD